MSTWKNVKTHLRDRYNLEAEGEYLVAIEFNFDVGVNQTVFVRYNRSGSGVEWVIIESPIASLGKIDLEWLIRDVSNLLGASVASYSDWVTLRHLIALASLELSDVSDAVMSVCGMAEELRSKARARGYD